MVKEPWMEEILQEMPYIGVDFELLSVIYLFNRMNKSIGFSKLCEVMNGKMSEGYANILSVAEQNESLVKDHADMQSDMVPPCAVNADLTLRDYIDIQSDKAIDRYLLRRGCKDIDGNMTWEFRADGGLNWFLRMFTATQLMDENSLVSTIAAEQFGSNVPAEMESMLIL